MWASYQLQLEIPGLDLDYCGSVILAGCSSGCWHESGDQACQLEVVVKHIFLALQSSHV